MKQVKYNPDDVIYKKGDKGGSLYLILEGEVEIYH